MKININWNDLSWKKNNFSDKPKFGSSEYDLERNKKIDATSSAVENNNSGYNGVVENIAEKRYNSKDYDSSNDDFSQYPPSFKSAKNITIIQEEEDVGDDTVTNINSNSNNNSDNNDDGKSLPSYEKTHRKLRERHIQLIGIGGTIGTALFVSIGSGLVNGGPGSLFLGFTLWCTVIIALTNSCAEMVTYLPISSPFITLAGRYVDDAFGVMAGWNYWLFEAALIPFEIVAVNSIIHFWASGYSPGIVIGVQIALYFAINVFAVKLYGETEFWLSLSKVILAVGLILFTLVVMCGGNPLHDKFGFRYWNNPGSFAEYYKEGSTGRFLGFLACFIQASFTIAGPDYVSMAAGEAENPRVIMPKAFKSVLIRLSAFFILGSLCVGILVPYNDPTLIEVVTKSAPGAAASPYVLAMVRLKIPVLPHIVNVMILLSAFSAGNSYTYCATRSLYGLALEKKAPKIFCKCTRNGVPIYATIVSLSAGLLGFLQISNSSAVVLQWIVNLVTASQLINFSVISLTYLRFYYALKAQGISRDTLPYKGIFQPFCGYFALVATTIMAFVGGYTVFLPGRWSVATFLFSYFSIFFAIGSYLVWKIGFRPKIVPLSKMDIYKDKREIDEYCEEYETIARQNLESRKQYPWWNWWKWGTQWRSLSIFSKRW